MDIDKSLTPKQSQCRLNLAFGSLILGGVIIVIIILAVCGVFSSGTRTKNRGASPKCGHRRFGARPKCGGSGNRSKYLLKVV